MGDKKGFRHEKRWRDQDNEQEDYKKMSRKETWSYREIQEKYIPWTGSSSSMFLHLLLYFIRKDEMRNIRSREMTPFHKTWKKEKERNLLWKKKDCTVLTNSREDSRREIKGTFKLPLDTCLVRDRLDDNGCQNLEVFICHVVLLGDHVFNLSVGVVVVV